MNVLDRSLFKIYILFLIYFVWFWSLMIDQKLKIIPKNVEHVLGSKLIASSSCCHTQRLSVFDDRLGRGDGRRSRRVNLCLHSQRIAVASLDKQVSTLGLFAVVSLSNFFVEKTVNDFTLKWNVPLPSGRTVNAEDWKSWLLREDKRKRLLLLIDDGDRVDGECEVETALSKAINLAFCLICKIWSFLLRA